jgi:hypothetical protein
MSGTRLHSLALFTWLALLATIPGLALPAQVSNTR